jgi:DNA-binding transcriptional regulator GbsR (MarR family)
MTDTRSSTLSPVAQKFILHWGEMGTRWGVNRTVAQVHALLYLSPRPLHAEEIAKTLRVARSNASTSLRELLGWRIVHAVSVLGDRRQHFESMNDPWEMFRVILEERKRREVDPTLVVVRECAAQLAQSGGDAYLRDRLKEMEEFLSTTMSLYDELQRLPMGPARGLFKLRGKMRKLLKG